jgi:hypothetical protein
MTEDLLTRIQREMDERLRELRGAMDEHERLTSELGALQDVPELLAALGPALAPGPPANVVRLPARRPLSRTRMVSPKVARLMRAPRRPALERSGVARVGVAHGGSSPVDDLWPHEAAEEIDVEAEVYERSL